MTSSDPQPNKHTHPRSGWVAYPLARRAVVIVTLGSLLFTLVSTLVQVYLSYGREISQINDRMQQIRVSQLGSLANSVWHFDDRQIDAQLQGWLNLQDIQYLELVVAGGPVYTAGQPVSKAKALAQSFPLEYDQAGTVTPLGRLTVTATTDGVWQRLQGQLVGILLAEALQIFLLAGFILVAVEWLFARPLNAIARYAETLDLDHLQEPLSLSRRRLATERDELGLVAQALNDMRQRLMEDMAERQRLDEVLRERERNYREIFNAPSEAILVHAVPDGHLLLVNSPMLHMYAYETEAEVLAGTVGDLSANTAPYTEAEAVAKIQKTLEDGPQIFEWLAKKKTGELFWVEISLRSSQIGGENRVLAVVRDITERKQAKRLIEAQEEQLMAQNEELLAQNEELATQGKELAEAEANLRQLNANLEQRVASRTAELSARTAELSLANTALQRAARLKDEFMASMSHELRTPLTGILTLSEALQMNIYDPITKRQHEALDMVQESGQHLLDLITDILDLSKIEAGKMELQVGTVVVNDLCQASLQFVRQLALTKKLQVSVVVDPAVPTLQADPRRLKQILINLLSNAVKFTPEGGTIGLEIAGDPAHAVVHFSVWDTGIGIAPENLPLLFRPFTQLDSRLSRKYSGTGLGLSLVMGMAELHGGSVSVESEPDRGSRFTVTLPAGPAEAALPVALARKPAARHVDPTGSPVSLLLVDDSDIVISTLTTFLKAHAYQVYTARHGGEALEKAHQLRPTMILLDIQMPELDGLQVLSQLRAEADPKLAATPVIALTALAMPGDREKCLAAGANDYLPKPIRLEDLLRAIEKQVPS
jgi:PAS domain S-box-containing protein